MSNFQLLSKQNKLNLIITEKQRAKHRIDEMLAANVDIFTTFTIESFIPETKSELHITKLHNTMNESVKVYKLANQKLEELGYKNV